MSGRVRTDGKFLRLGDQKFWVKGVTYGPFRPQASGVHLPETHRIDADFRQLRELGANTLRVYHVPPRWFLDMAAAHELKVLVDVPWSKHRCFLDSRADRETGREAVRQAARSCRDHEALLALSVVNELPPDVVRWSGTEKVERFVEELVEIAKQEDPRGLVTFANFPPTEYLHPRTVDFYSFNVYLHRRDRFRAYLQRLQNQSDEKPLLLGEYGIDSIRNGEQGQAEMVGMHLEEVFRCGLVGSCVFSFTDEWFTGGHPIEDWAFGLVRADRSPKPAFHRVGQIFRAESPLPKLRRSPRVSVVVCSYNGSKTLDGCLSSLRRLNYPDYEVVVIDDGSTDKVPEICARHDFIRYFRQPNKGLSAARNQGMELANGEVIAYTDDDCFADEDWLYFLVSKLVDSDASGVGGPNLLPEGDGPVAACVSASPGTPAHILVDDSVAEHVPGCNMAFWADRLRAIGGFDPAYRAAGDDVDACWRLQAEGDHIVYSPAAMVWHHRRATVEAYLKQQRGYGIAEALLKRKHPEKFRGFRADLSWLGRIYTRAGLGLNLGRPTIHYGVFGSGLFQTLYSPEMVWWPLLATSLEWWLAILLLLGLAIVFHPQLLIFERTAEGLMPASILAQVSNPLFLLPLGMLLTTALVAWWVAGQAQPLPHQRRWWSRALIAAMHVAQPVERGWARYKTRFETIEIPAAVHAIRNRWEQRAASLLDRNGLELWSESWATRETLLTRLVALAARHQWFLRIDPGWEPRDVRFYGDRWAKCDIVTVSENHGGGRLLTRVRLISSATLYHKALAFLIVYVLTLAWFVRPISALLLTPALGLMAMTLFSARRVLRRTVVAALLEVAQELGMTVVDAPDLLKGTPVPEPPPRAAPPPPGTPPPPAGAALSPAPPEKTPAEV
ncbi:MAG: glycosyltransferase [Vicinamibacteria bacterium]